MVRWVGEARYSIFEKPEAMQKSQGGGQVGRGGSVRLRTLGDNELSGRALWKESSMCAWR